MPRKPLTESEKFKAFVNGQKFDELTHLESESTVEILNNSPNHEVDTVTEFKRESEIKDEPGARVRITVDLPKQRHRKLKQLVAEIDTDINALINRVIEKMVGL